MALPTPVVAPPPPSPADLAGPPPDATVTESGLAYVILHPGAGAVPRVDQQVLVEYSMWTTDGNLLDSSRSRGAPALFRPNQLIPGWTEALQLMQEGEELRVWIPADLAYGEEAGHGRPVGMLICEIELIEVIEP